MDRTCVVCGEAHPGRLGCPRFDSLREGQHQPVVTYGGEVVTIVLVLVIISLMFTGSVAWYAGRMSALESPACTGTRP